MVRNGALLFTAVGKLLQQSIAAQFKFGNGLAADVGKGVFVAVVIGTLQQNGVHEPVTEFQVNAHRRYSIGKHLTEGGSQFVFHKQGGGAKMNGD